MTAKIELRVIDDRSVTGQQFLKNKKIIKNRLERNLTHTQRYGHDMKGNSATWVKFQTEMEITFHLDKKRTGFHFKRKKKQLRANNILKKINNNTFLNSF
jgi:hypothetical protein